MKPLVSILIPCYNAEKWLAETLKSTLDQTWHNKEIIVIDDGSTDGSLAIAKRFESPIVKVIHQENRGASAARNLAFKEAQGNFIQYLDADDLLSPRKIEKQVLLLQKNPPGTLAVCGTVHFFDGQAPDEGILEKGFPFLVDSDEPLNWLLKLLGTDSAGGMVHPGAWLTPRSVADAAGTWNEELSLDDDGEYFARVVLNSTGIRRIEAEVSYYRKYRHGKNLSRASSERHYQSALLSMNLKAQHILTKTNSPIAKRALARNYMTVAIQAYPDYRTVSKAALKKVEEMGGIDWLPTMGGWRAELVKKLFGWKMARMVSIFHHRWKAIFAQRFWRST